MKGIRASGALKRAMKCSLRAVPTPNPTLRPHPCSDTLHRPTSSILPANKLHITPGGWASENWSMNNVSLRWPDSPNWSSSYVSPGSRLQVEYLSSIDVLSRLGLREGVARPERPSGCVLAKLLGVSNPRLLWGRSSLYSRRQSSSTTLASVNVQSCSRSSPLPGNGHGNSRYTHSAMDCPDQCRGSGSRRQQASPAVLLL